VHRAALDLRKGLSHFEAQVSHFSTGTAALFGRRLHSTDNHRLLISCGKNSNGEEFKTFGILLNPETLIYERDEDFILEQWEAGMNGGTEKLNPLAIAKVVASGPASKKDLAEKVMEKFLCKKSVAYDAIGKANGDTIELNIEKKFELKKTAS
jgi:hypothetical protein